VNLADLTIDPQHLWRGAWPEGQPLGFIDLARVAEMPVVVELPPYPVIGLGDQAHPLARLLDAVAKPPIGAPALARQVLAHPHAAAVTVQLLRSLSALPVEQGLVAESIAYGLLQGSDDHRRWIASRPQPTPRAAGAVDLTRAGDQLKITLADPAAGNVIDRAMRDELYEAFALAALDPEITGVSLRAQGRCFSLGAELGEFGTTTDPVAAHFIRMQTLPAHMASRCAHKLDVHVQGACVGSGLELAAWGSRLTATSDAWFQLPELAMGILPGAGGCVSLSRRIGRQRAALLILSGKRISARTALDWWLIDALVDEPA
jgi:hypothetical protein